MKWRGILINRFTIVFGIFAVMASVWNMYVSFNDDGYLSGQVFDLNGNPVSGAAVTLSELSLINRNIVATAETDAEGRFNFEKHGRHAVILTADKDGVGQSRRHNIRLYFRNQNLVLSEQVILDPEIMTGPKLSANSGNS